MFVGWRQCNLGDHHFFQPNIQAAPGKGNEVAEHARFQQTANCRHFPLVRRTPDLTGT